MVQQQINANDFNWHKQRLKTKGFNMNDLFSLNLNGDATTVRLCCIRWFFSSFIFSFGTTEQLPKKRTSRKLRNWLCGSVHFQCAYAFYVMIIVMVWNTGTMSQLDLIELSLFTTTAFH